MTKTINERVEWLEDGKAILHVEETDEIKDDKGNVVGKSSKTYEIRTTGADIEAGIQAIHATIANLRKRLETENGKLERLGERVTLNPTLEKLNRQLTTLQRYNQQEQHRNEVESIETDLKIQQDLLAKRSASLQRRPTEEAR